LQEYWTFDREKSWAHTATFLHVFLFLPPIFIYIYMSMYICIYIYIYIHIYTSHTYIYTYPCIYRTTCRDLLQKSPISISKTIRWHAMIFFNWEGSFSKEPYFQRALSRNTPIFALSRYFYRFGKRALFE